MKNKSRGFQNPLPSLVLEIASGWAWWFFLVIWSKMVIISMTIKSSYHVLYSIVIFYFQELVLRIPKRYWLQFYELWLWRCPSCKLVNDNRNLILLGFAVVGTPRANSCQEFHTIWHDLAHLNNFWDLERSLGSSKIL